MKRIVVVDDSATMRKSVGLSLKALVIEQLKLKRGPVALEKINELANNGEDIALCITDVNMPGMDD